MRHENLIVQILMIVFILGAGFLGSRILANKVLANAMVETQANHDQMMQQIKDKISKENDAYTLTTKGARAADKNPELAKIYLDRAVEVNKDYRDAWLWKGYAELKIGSNEQAVNSLETAAQIDPIHTETYKYLAIAYSQVGNEEKSKTANEKYQYLSKTSE